MPALPLTHHEILALVAPFSRRGLRLDLPRSDRIARCLAFQPVARCAASSGEPDLHEVLTLEDVQPGAARTRWRLTRLLTHADGRQASLQAEAEDVAGLLHQVEAVPPGRHFSAAPGYRLALSHALADSAPATGGATPTQCALVLTRGEARLEGLTLVMTVLRVRGIPADVVLQGEDGKEGAMTSLPQDLLAVLGWSWSRLSPAATAAALQWTATCRLRRHEPARSIDAEARLLQAARHLAATLAEPPRRFHERQIVARWRVTARRCVPLLTCIGLAAGAVAVPQMDLPPNSVVRMLIFHAPPLLLMAFFCMHEMPRIEIPPLPRRLKANSWRAAVPRPDGAPSTRSNESDAGVA